MSINSLVGIHSPHFSDLSGKSSPVAEVSPITISPEELAEIEKKNELKLKIKEEHLAALHLEGRRRNQIRSCFH